MNILNCTYPNPFINKLYPDGLFGDIYIGNVIFSSNNDIYIDIHTQMKPAIETKKMGIFGLNYNIIVIRLSAVKHKNIIISNWGRQDFLPLKITEEDDGFFLEQKKDEFVFQIKAKSFLFGNLSVYLK